MEKSGCRSSNVVSNDEDIFQVGGGGYVRFFPEDEKRMELMSATEKREYKTELLMNGRYIDTAGLAHRVQQGVPETGDFEGVKARFQLPNQKYGVVARGWLVVYQPPKGVEGRERMRALDLVVYKEGSPYVCQRMLKCGTKQDIINALNDKSTIDNIFRALPEMLNKLFD